MNVLKKSGFLMLVILLPLVTRAAEPVAKPAINQAAGQQRFMQRLKQELRLSEDQVKAIEKINQEAHAQARANRLEGPADELEAAMAVPPDSKAFDEAVQKASDAAAEMARKRIVAMAENRKKVYAILNAEQQKKFLNLRLSPQPRQVRELPGKQSADKKAADKKSAE